MIRVCLHSAGGTVLAVVSAVVVMQIAQRRADRRGAR